MDAEKEPIWQVIRMHLKSQPADIPRRISEGIICSRMRRRSFWSLQRADSGRSSKELKEDASAKIEQIKSESIKERMQRIHKTGTAGKRYSAPAVVPETPAETVEDPAESSTTIVPAGPGSDIGPGHGPAQEPAVGPAAEIGQ